MPSLRPLGWGPFLIGLLDSSGGEQWANQRATPQRQYTCHGPQWAEPRLKQTPSEELELQLPPLRPSGSPTFDL